MLFSHLFSSYALKNESTKSKTNNRRDLHVVARRHIAKKLCYMKMMIQNIDKG